MILAKLQLQNFRNYEKIDFNFNPEIKKIVLFAHNAAGKTNILEAIYILALTKSFRGKKYQDLILWGKDLSSIRAELVSDTKLEVFIDEMVTHKKVLKVNDVKTESHKYIGELNVVFFHPEDLNMLYLSPSLRRKYLNILLCQTDRKYLLALSDYKRTIKQRNTLLQKIHERRAKKSDLDIWDEKLVESGSIIVEKRAKTVRFLNEHIENTYRKISHGRENLKIKYRTNAEDNFLDKLAANIEKDIRKGVTSIGPHRDDMVFYLNGHNINEFGSRGEFRTILLAMKIAEIAFIEEKTDKRPILLLDDVFSELDPDRQKHLFESLGQCQTLITTTDMVHLEELNEKIHVFEIENGKLVRSYIK